MIFYFKLDWIAGFKAYTKPLLFLKGLGKHEN